MPLRDRLWWLWAGGAVLTAVASVAVPYLLLSQLLPLDDRLGESHTLTYLLGGFIALGLLFLTGMLTTAAVYGCKRTARRKRALRGDLSAMPEAALSLEPARAPDVTTEPLHIFWRATKFERRVQAPFRLLFTALRLTLVVLQVILTLIGAILNLRQGDGLDLAGLLFVAASSIGMALLIVLGIAIIRYVPTLFGRPYGVTARGDGIECHTEFGRTIFIPWGEMRLLEVDGSKSGLLQDERRGYRLYGVNSVAAWHDDPAKYHEYAPDGISSGEMAVRLRSLLDLINAHTGLVPRTLSKGLQGKATQAEGEVFSSSSRSPVTSASAASTGVGRRRQPWRDAGLAALLGMATLGLAAAALLVPLTPLPALNLASAASLVGVALLLFVVALRTPFVDRTSRRELRTAAQSLELPLGYAADVVYALRYDMLSPKSRLALAILGLLLLVNLPGLLLMLVAPLTVTFNWASGALNWFPSPVSFALAVLVGIYGFVGFIFLVLAGQLGGILLRADADGISMRIGPRAVTLAWARAETIAARPRPGASAAYVVEGDASRTSVLWPIHPKYLRTLPPGDAATTVTSRQLAAVAQERAGLRLSVEQQPDKG